MCNKYFLGFFSEGFFRGVFLVSVIFPWPFLPPPVYNILNTTLEIHILHDELYHNFFNINVFMYIAICD